MPKSSKTSQQQYSQKFAGNKRAPLQHQNLLEEVNQTLKITKTNYSRNIVVILAEVDITPNESIFLRYLSLSLSNTQRFLNENSKINYQKNPRFLEDFKSLALQNKEPFSLRLNCETTSHVLEYPAKGLNCYHAECFDLKTFLVMVNSQSISSKWKCPICKGKVLLSEIIIDHDTIREIKSLKEDLENEIYRENQKRWKEKASKQSLPYSTFKELRLTVLYNVKNREINREIISQISPGIGQDKSIFISSFSCDITMNEEDFIKSRFNQQKIILESKILEWSKFNSAQITQKKIDFFRNNSTKPFKGLNLSQVCTLIQKYSNLDFSKIEIDRVIRRPNTRKDIEKNYNLNFEQLNQELNVFTNIVSSIFEDLKSIKLLQILIHFSSQKLDLLKPEFSPSLDLSLLFEFMINFAIHKAQPIKINEGKYEEEIFKNLGLMMSVFIDTMGYQFIKNSDDLMRLGKAMMGSFPRFFSYFIEFKAIKDLYPLRNHQILYFFLHFTEGQNLLLPSAVILKRVLSGSYETTKYAFFAWYSIFLRVELLLNKDDSVLKKLTSEAYILL